MTETVLSNRFLVRGGTAANLTTVNEILKVRELCFETETGKFKLGDGVTAWNSLAYRGTVDDAITNGVLDRAPSQNAVFDALALKADLAGGTFTGDISVPDEAYDATAWNGSMEVPTKNAIRDKIETLGGSGQAAIQFKDEGSNVGSSGAITSLDVVGSGGSLAVVGTAATLTLSGGGGGSGVLVQRKVTVIDTEINTTASIPVDDTKPQVGEGASIGSVSITPTSTSNYLLVYFMGNMIGTAGACRVTFSLFKDSGADCLNANDVTLAGAFSSQPHFLTYVDQAVTTAAQSWSVRFGAGGVSVTLNAAGAASVYGTNIPISYIVVEEWTP